jgi:uncharacterized membrane protein YoaT (DUF817 family)
MKSTGYLLIMVCLVLIAMEHLKVIDIFSVVGLIIGLYMVMFPDKAQALIDKLKSTNLPKPPESPK